MTVSKAVRTGQYSNDFVSVRKFNVRGSGDETTKIQNAINSGEPWLYWPPATYTSEQLTPISNQEWVGASRKHTILQMPQTNQTLDYNLIHGGSSNLTGFKLKSMTLKGSLDYQTSAAASGQVGFALYCRGAINDFEMYDVLVTKFGDQMNYSGGGGGGGVVLGSPTSTPTTGFASGNIKIHKSFFDINSNVPGLYISQGGTGCMKLVEVLDNFFSGGHSVGSAQNCIYILGADATRFIEQVTVQGNRGRIATDIDQFIELNWVRDYNVSGNSLIVESGVTVCGGHTLVRDGCINGTVNHNTGRDYSGVAASGVSLVRFASPGTGEQEDTTVDHNTFIGFDIGIQLDTGSDGCKVVHNILRACGQGIRAAAASNSEIEHNKIYECGYAGVIAGGAAGSSNLKIRRNESFGCTTGAWTGTVPNENITGLVFAENEDSGSAGSYLLDLDTAAATGNRFEENRSSLLPMNPSYIGSFSYIKLKDKESIAFTNGDTTPAVNGGNIFHTANSGATTITNFDNGHVGQRIYVALDSNTTIDFSGTNLKGNGGSDLSGSATNAIWATFNGTYWLCTPAGA